MYVYMYVNIYMKTTYNNTQNNIISVDIQTNMYDEWINMALLLLLSLYSYCRLYSYWIEFFCCTVCMPFFLPPYKYFFSYDTTATTTKTSKAKQSKAGRQAARAKASSVQFSWVEFCCILKASTSNQPASQRTNQLTNETASQAASQSVLWYTYKFCVQFSSVSSVQFSSVHIEYTVWKFSSVHSTILLVRWCCSWIYSEFLRWSFSILYKEEEKHSQTHTERERYYKSEVK